MILDILRNFELESKARHEEGAQGDIGALVILDRSVDYVTPLLTQSTYAGFMDETFGIKNSFKQHSI